jgi:RTX calcium-binding nonapeptide repeat (4 copies)
VRRLCFILLALVCALLVPTSASAAKVIGSSLPSWSGDTIECTDPGGCTFVPTSIAGKQVVVPYDGVLVRWAGRVPAGSPSSIALRVLRPTAGGQLSSVATLPSTPSVNGTIASWGWRVPVKAGDRIGLDLDDGEQIGIFSHASFDSTSLTFAPLLATSETRAPDSTDSDDFEALFNASIEPDVDGDGYGDESDDRCPELADAQICNGDVRLDLLPHASRESLTRGDGVVLAGGQLTLRATVRAILGRVPNVVLTLTLPPELPGVAASGPGPCSVAVDRIVCQVGALAENGEVTVTAQVRGLRPGGLYGGGPGGAPVARVRASVTTGLSRATDSKQTMIRILSTKPCGNPAITGRLPNPGTFAGDSLVGTASADTFDGLSGDDCLYGKGANDTLGGGIGNDRLEGAYGNDRLRGDAGNDRVIGGPGEDLLDGGWGKDTIDAVDRKRDTVTCGTGRDSARVDRIDSVAGCERVTRVPAKRRR